MTDMAQLRAWLAAADPRASAAELLEQMVRLGHDRLPLPAAGRTIDRWRALAAVAEHDLGLAKLYEGHTDALAILEELGAAASPGIDPRSTWGVWAAEAPEGRAVIEPVAAVSGPSPGGEAAVRLIGGKCWCSGAGSASDALLTAWQADGGGPQLVWLRLQQPGVSVDGSSWQAVGMAASASLDVRFQDARARLVGPAGAYLSRPGFWQGGAGVAACWYGGSLAIAGALHRAAASAAGSSAPSNPFRMAALGRVDKTLRATGALFREGAAWIDAHPQGDASDVALRLRLAADDCARLVLDEAGRSLGAAPFCRDSRFARAAADLPVFIRQSHGDRDFAALGERVLARSKAVAGPAPRRGVDEERRAIDAGSHHPPTWQL